MKFYQSSTATPSYPRTPSSSPRSLLSAIYLIGFNPLCNHLKDSFLGYLNEVGDNEKERWLRWGFRTVDRYYYGSSIYVGMNSLIGKLGFKEESAGKLRVFAMLDILTQWTFKPLHDRMFEILKQIPQDGTFHQVLPLNLLVKRLPAGTPLWSLDQSSATDRIPALLAKDLLSSLTTPRLAEFWYTILTDRIFDGAYKKEVVSVKYATGQPMGAQTSWSLGLALLHHAIVQFSAFKAGVVKNAEWFQDYALLGDDIVIANNDVAREYQLVLTRIGVECGIHKSLVSPKGLAQEFAKRFYYKGVDMSPVPLKEIVASCATQGSSLEAARKYNLKESDYMYLLGYGYKSLSKQAWDVRRLPVRFAQALQSYRFFVSNTMFNPIPIGWQSVADNRRQAIENTILDSLRQSILNRVETMLKELESFPRYFGDTSEDSSLEDSESDYMEGETLPLSQLKEFYPEDFSSKASEQYGEDYWNEVKVDGELWLEQTYRMFYQDQVRRIFAVLLDFRTELQTNSQSSLFHFKYTRLLMIDQGLSEVSRMIQSDKLASKTIIAGKPHFIIQSYQKMFRKV